MITYTYDATGNLVASGKTYDSKMSFRRTNKIWMLIDRIYGISNDAAATRYNSAGLPLNTFLSGIFLGNGYNDSAAITYSCK